MARKKKKRLHRVLNMRVDDELREIVEDLARQRGVSLSSAARTLMIAGLAARILHDLRLPRREAGNGK